MKLTSILKEIKIIRPDMRLDLWPDGVMNKGRSASEFIKAIQDDEPHSAYHTFNFRINKKGYPNYVGPYRIKDKINLSHRDDDNIWGVIDTEHLNFTEHKDVLRILKEEIDLPVTEGAGYIFINITDSKIPVYLNGEMINSQPISSLVNEIKIINPGNGIRISGKEFSNWADLADYISDSYHSVKVEFNIMGNIIPGTISPSHAPDDYYSVLGVLEISRDLDPTREIFRNLENLFKKNDIEYWSQAGNQHSSIVFHLFTAATVNGDIPLYYNNKLIDLYQ